MSAKHSDVDLVSKFLAANSKNLNVHPDPSNPTAFKLDHAFGSVLYDCEGFLKQNRMVLTEVPVAYMRTSELPLLAHLFTGDAWDDLPDHGRVWRTRNALSRLVSSLKKTEIHFVRCLLPYSEGSFIKFNHEKVRIRVTLISGA